MSFYVKHKKPLLRRRSNLVKLLQASLDYVGVFAILRMLIIYRTGAMTSDDAIMLLVLTGIMAISYEYFGIYRNNADFISKTAALFQAWSVSFLGLVGLFYLSREGEDYSRLFLLEMYVIGFVAQLGFHAAVKSVHHALVRNSPQVNNVLIIGEGALADFLRFKISSNLWMGERVVGMVSLTEHAEYDTEASQSPVLGGIGDLPQLVAQHQIDIVYIGVPLDASGILPRIYQFLLDKYITIHWVPDIFSLRLVNHSVSELSGIPVLTLSETPLVGLNRIAKLMEDMLLSSIILLMIAPILLTIAVLIRLDSPGPVFYRQKRTGWNGKVFRIWKFRSMYVQSEQEGATVKQAEKNDPRVTRVGAFIRRTSLDELPQIFNVLSGDMSLVGPRPHAIQHDAEYSRRINDYFARLHIKPGMTGLAQVRGLRGETRDINLMIQRVESDIEYINHWSIWLDLSIMLGTLKKLADKNAY